MGAIGRFLVATAAGAGLGAGAAFARRRRLAANAAPAAWEARSTGSGPPTAGGPATPAVDAVQAAEPTDVADLEAARARLRQRAAELRAEMERSPSSG